MRKVLSHILIGLGVCTSVAPPQPAWAQYECGGYADHVVLLKAERTDGADVAEQFGTGIVLTEHGLVLTTWDLLGDLKPLQLVNAQDTQTGEVTSFDELVKISNAKTDAPAQIYGYDWHRKLLLLRIPGLENVKPVDIARARPRRRALACAVGFDQNQEMTPTKPREIRPNTKRDFTLRLDAHEMDNTSIGGAVIDPVTGELIGMLESGDADFLPIQFADTLLSQLFMSRIVADLERIKTVSDELSTGISWGFQIIENETADIELNEDKSHQLKIRFFFTQHLEDTATRQGLRLAKVNVLTKLSGWKSHDVFGSVDDFVSLSFVGPTRPITLKPGVTHFDYDALEYVDEARKQGFYSLHTLELILAPVFLIDGQEVTPQTQSKRIAKFVIPLGGAPE